MPEQTPESSKRLSRSEVLDLYEDLRGQFGSRNADYHLLRQLVGGFHWDNGDLSSEVGRYSLVANYLRPTVRKGVELLAGTMPGIQVIPPGPDQESRDLAEFGEAILYATWDHSRMARVLRRVAYNAITFQTGWIYYWWDPTMKRACFKSIAPDNVFPVRDGDTIEEVVVVSRKLTRLLKRQYPNLASDISSDGEGDEVIHDDPHFNANPASLAGQTKVIDWFDRHGNWTRVMGNAVYSQNLGYGIESVPLIEFANELNGDEGDSLGDLEDVIVLNQYLDDLYSQQADIIKRYADPTIIDRGSGQSVSSVKKAVSGGGMVLPIRKDGDIRFLNWEGTLPEIGAQIDRTLMFIQDLSGKPASSYGQTITNQSGVVTNMALQPTVASNAAKESLFGEGLSELNRAILTLYAKFMKGETIKIDGIRQGRTHKQRSPFAMSGTGADLKGWTHNRIKWPSALRTDDPVYVQSILSRMTSDPPGISVYTALEELGVEDVEMELDRIAQQLEDPRMHPDRLSAAIDAAGALGDMRVPQPGAGLVDPAAAAPNADMAGAAEAAGSPHRDQLSEGY